MPKFQQAWDLGSCDRHGRCDRSVSYEEQTETPIVDQKINVNKTDREQKLSEQNKKLELKIKDAEELSGSLMECQRKSGIVVNQTQMIQNEVRENVNNLEQAINAALEGKLINLESRLQNKLSAVTNDVSTLTNKLDAQKNSNDEQNRLLTSQLEALSQETQFLNTSIISTGDAKKKRATLGSRIFPLPRAWNENGHPRF
ncbi:hypothetical protein B566_EDAN005133 [Ephemera danica]|nr:hypothetical protein B566_EDAN005133 [Ephemera danica]